MNAGSRANHDRFCRTEGWDLVRSARGGQVRHHVTYELSVPDGRFLRTRISRPVSKVVYGPNLWSTILRDQLDVTEPEFWACVDNKVKPDRGTATVEIPSNAIPAQLVYQLIHHARVPEDEVAAMTLEEAIRRIGDFWSRPPT